MSYSEEEESRFKLQRSRCKSSKYRGVSKCSKDGRWQARIRVGKVVKYLGRFCTEEEAAEAYDKGAMRYHNYRAVTNFDRNSYDQVNPASEAEINAEMASLVSKKNNNKGKRSRESESHRDDFNTGNKKNKLRRKPETAPLLSHSAVPTTNFNFLVPTFPFSFPTTQIPFGLPQLALGSAPSGFHFLETPQVFSPNCFSPFLQDDGAVTEAMTALLALSRAAKSTSASAVNIE